MARGYYGRQQNVDGSAGVVDPSASPPLGWQDPGVYVTGPAALLSRAEPGGTPMQSGPVASSGSVKGSGTLQSLSLNTEIEPAHELPLGAEHAHGEHARESST